MEILKDIPAEIKARHEIRTIQINIDQRRATAQITTMRSDGTVYPQMVTVDIASLLTTATDVQRKIIRTFFKQLIANLVDISDAEVPEVFAD